MCLVSAQLIKNEYTVVIQTTVCHCNSSAKNQRFPQILTIGWRLELQLSWSFHESTSIELFGIRNLPLLDAHLSLHLLKYKFRCALPPARPHLIYNNISEYIFKFAQDMFTHIQPIAFEVSFPQSQILISGLVLLVLFATLYCEETNENEIGNWDWIDTPNAIAYNVLEYLRAQDLDTRQYCIDNT